MCFSQPFSKYSLLQSSGHGPLIAQKLCLGMQLGVKFMSLMVYTIYKARLSPTFNHCCTWAPDTIKMTPKPCRQGQQPVMHLVFCRVFKAPTPSNMYLIQSLNDSNPQVYFLGSKRGGGDEKEIIDMTEVVISARHASPSHINSIMFTARCVCDHICLTKPSYTHLSRFFYCVGRFCIRFRPSPCGRKQRASKQRLVHFQQQRATKIIHYNPGEDWLSFRWKEISLSYFFVRCRAPRNHVFRCFQYPPSSLWAGYADHPITQNFLQYPSIHLLHRSYTTYQSCSRSRHLWWAPPCRTPKNEAFVVVGVQIFENHPFSLNRGYNHVKYMYMELFVRLVCLGVVFVLVGDFQEPVVETRFKRIFASQPNVQYTLCTHASRVNLAHRLTEGILEVYRTFDAHFTLIMDNYNAISIDLSFVLTCPSVDDIRPPNLPQMYHEPKELGHWVPWGPNTERCT